MNSKHLACTVIGICIAAMAYGTMMFHNKLKIVKDDELTAQSAYDSAVFARSAQQRTLVILEKSTKGIRDYLAEWEPHLKQTRNPQFGEALINLRIKQGDLVTLSQGFETVSFNKGGTIPRTLQARLVFDDDYAKTLNWLANLEGTMPASRVSSCRLSKGESGNDVKMEVTIDVPILEASDKKTKA